MGLDLFHGLLNREIFTTPARAKILIEGGEGSTIRCAQDGCGAVGVGRGKIGFPILSHPRKPNRIPDY
jgi:hypothetical protein